MKTKKKLTTIFSVMLTVLVIGSLAACGNKDVPKTDDPPSQSENQNSTSPSDTNATDNSPMQGENNILIAYFSRWGNTEYPDNVDASTSASIVIDGERFGTTEYVARMIQETVGGDVHLIETAIHYTADFDELRDVNHNEMSNNILPKLKESNLDIHQTTIPILIRVQTEAQTAIVKIPIMVAIIARQDLMQVRI